MVPGQDHVPATLGVCTGALAQVRLRVCERAGVSSCERLPACVHRRVAWGRAAALWQGSASAPHLLVPQASAPLPTALGAAS